MSDLSIPGVSNKYNTSKMIQDLVKVERIPLERMEERVETYERQKKVWQGLNKQISSFKDNSRRLFSHDNPFGERIANSEDESVFKAIATREAYENNYRIKVIQTAQADRFLSSSVSKDYEVASGEYGFKIADEEETFSFKGGSLEKFAARINAKSKGKLRASVVNDSANSQVILVESLKEGSDNRLELTGDFLKTGLDLGLIEKNNTSQIDVNFSNANLKPTAVGSRQVEIINEKRVTIGPESQAELDIPSLKGNFDNLILEMDVYIKNIPEDEYDEPPAPPRPSLDQQGTVEFDGITLRNEGFELPLPDWTPPPKPERVDNLQVLAATDKGRTIALPELKDQEGLQKIKITLKDYLDGLDGLTFDNKNTHREISFENIRIYDPTARGEYSPSNPINTAEDAILELNGIEVTRSQNEIDDLIAGVTLTLQKPSEDELDLTVEPDRELITEQVINFLGSYNRLLAEIQILTKNEGSIIEDYIPEEEHEQARENLGLFQGDISLNQIRSSLQRLMMNPYPTSEGRELSLLAQIGISTNKDGTSGGGLDASKLRGFMEMDFEKFEHSLETNLEAVKELFGKDTDNDLVIDSGVAFSTDTYLKPYTQIGGIIPLKLSSYDRQMERTKEDIEDYKLHLEDFEANLKRKYGMMEGMLGSMESSFDAIENFNRNNSGQQ